MRMILSAALALLLVPTTVAAQTETPPTAKVQYRDLDLRTDRGVHRLRARVHEAAISVCAQSGFTKTGLLWTPAAHQCQSDAIAGAETRVELAVSQARNTQVASVDLGDLSVGRASGR